MDRAALVVSSKTSLDVCCESLNNENMKFRLSLHMQIVLLEFKNKLEFIQIIHIKCGYLNIPFFL